MRLSLFVTATALLTASLAAHADTFNFSFGNSADSFYGSGTLTGSQIAAGEFLITGITGTTHTDANHPNSAIEGVDSFASNDNLLFVSNGQGTFDNGGLSYLLANGAQINLYTEISGTDAEILARVNGNEVAETVPYNVTAVTPEPSSIALLGTGLLGMVGTLRRRLA